MKLLTVYPRVCGGTADKSGPSALQEGLSPRVRGNHHTTVLYAVRKGSIPACAGEPFPSMFSGLYDRVYPRVCGGTYATG